jgi:two-component SAPR family response regulator
METENLKHEPRVLLISMPGASRDGLHAVLPALIRSAQVIDAEQPTQASVLAYRMKPDLVIIDTEIGYGNSRWIVLQLLTLDDHVQIVLLAEASQWRRWKNSHLPCQVLLKGFSTQELKTVIEFSLSAPAGS